MEYVGILASENLTLKDASNGFSYSCCPQKPHVIQDTRRLHKNPVKK